MLQRGDVVRIPKGSKLLTRVTSKLTMSGWKDEEVIIRSDREFAVLSNKTTVECKVLLMSGEYSTKSKVFWFKDTGQYQVTRKIEIPA